MRAHHRFVDLKSLGSKAEYSPKIYTNFYGWCPNRRSVKPLPLIRLEVGKWRDTSITHHFSRDSLTTVKLPGCSREISVPTPSPLTTLLENRLVVGRVALDHQSWVRFLVLQPNLYWRIVQPVGPMTLTHVMMVRTHLLQPVLYYTQSRSNILWWNLETYFWRWKINCHCQEHFEISL